MMDAIGAMSSWVGALSRGGVLMGHEEEEGAILAHEVLGTARLEELREWFSSQTRDVVERERRGAVHACIWMAQADRELATDEIELLERIIEGSELEERSAHEELAEVFGVDEDRADEIRESVLA